MTHIYSAVETCLNLSEVEGVLDKVIDLIERQMRQDKREPYQIEHRIAVRQEGETINPGYIVSIVALAK